MKFDNAINALKREIETIERLIPHENDEWRQRLINGINEAIEILKEQS